MAKCKSCKTNIPEGDEYCNDCQDKANAKANESYLDSLLNSVKNSPSTENIYKKKNNSNENNGNPDYHTNQVQKTVKEQDAQIRQEKEPIQTSEIEDDDLYGVDFSDIEDFDQFNLDEDLGDIESNVIISDEDLFGESLSSLLEEDGNEEENIDPQTEVEKVVEDAYADEQQSQRYVEDEEATVAMDEAEEVDQPQQEENSVDEMSSPREIDYIEETNTDFTERPNDFDQPDNIQLQDEYSELSEDTDIDLDLDELLNSLDTQSLEAIVDKNMANPDEDMFSTFGDENVEEMANHESAAGKNKNAEFEQVEADQDDFLSLLSQMSDEDSSAEDIKAISELLTNNSTTSKKSNMPSNVGEVFSDALKAVSSLDDYELEEAKILGKVPAKGAEKSTRVTKGKASKEVKNKKEKKKKEKKNKGKAVKEKSGLSLFQRLFGNIKDDKTAEKHEADQKKLNEPKAEKTKKTKGKAKKGVAPSDEETEEFGEKKGGKDKAAKKESRKEKAEKKKKAKEVIQVIDEIDEDPGRINRTGAIIVFFFFSIIALILILGTNLVTYTLSIQHATTYFGHRKYTQAYNEVYGVEIKDEDIEIYDKIMTVMFVNKQLNSYNNYYSLERYPEALDSLLKGLSRYEKYIELATILGIESDLDYVRTQILAELSNVFNLSEAEAMKILKLDNLDDYSMSVYDVVLEKMNN